MGTKAAVDYTFTGDAKDVVSEQQKVIQQLVKINQKIGKQGRKSRTVKQQVVGDLRSMVKGYLGVQVAVQGIFKALRAVSEENERLKNEISETTVTLDERFRRTALQLGLTSPEFVLGQIAPIAKRTATPLDEAADAAKELGSQGVKAVDIFGGVLEEVLRTAAATGQRQNISQLSGAMTSFLREQGKVLSADEFNTLGTQLFNLFKGRVFQPTDLPSLAAIAQPLVAAGIPQAEQLAIFTLLKESTGSGEKAATSLRNLVSILQQAPGLKGEQAALLKKAGIDPQAINLVGESFEQALDELAAGLGRLSKADRPVLLGKIFGREVSAAAAAIIEKRGQIPGLVSEQANVKGILEAIALTTAGTRARQTRLEIDKATILTKEGFDAPTADEINRILGNILDKAALEGPGGRALSTLQRGGKGIRTFLEPITGGDPLNTALQSLGPDQRAEFLRILDQVNKGAPETPSSRRALESQRQLRGGARDGEAQRMKDVEDKIRQASENMTEAANILGQNSPQATVAPADPNINTE